MDVIYSHTTLNTCATDGAESDLEAANPSKGQQSVLRTYTLCLSEHRVLISRRLRGIPVLGPFENDSYLVDA